MWYGLTHVAFRFIIFLVLGSLAHIIDARYGYRLYRWGYSMTHKDPLPVEVELSFLYGQPKKKHFTVALILSTLLIFMIGYFSNYNILTHLVFWVIGIPALMLGFATGPWIARGWSKKDELFESLDTLEKKGMAPKATPASSANPAPVMQPEPVVQEKPKEDPRAAIDRFASGSR